MLGKLFSRAPAALAGTSNTSLPQSARHPESVQEDLHTRNLLFPDAQALYQHRHDQVFPLAATPALPSSSTSNAFDYEGDIELEERDVRVLIMQGATPSIQTPYLLYDSHAPAAPPERQPPSDPRRNPMSPRKSSLSHSRPVIIQQDMPTPRQQGTFERRASVHSRYNHGESEAQKALREYREEIGTFSSCIFANSEIMAYRGTSTKVHVIPTEVRPNEISTSFFGDGRGSIGRSSARSSKLAQSFSSEVLSPTHPSFSVSTPRMVERRKVLITRLFPVHIAADDTPVSSTRGQEAEDSSGFPFPKAEDEPPVKMKPKMKKTPMYAIALVIQLPRTVPAPASKSGLRVSSSYTEQESFPSSFNSTRKSGWTMVGSGFGHESFETSYSTELEDQLDAITQHWDIIMRTLTRLQSIVATVLSPMLKQFDIPVPEPIINPTLHQTQSSRHLAFDARQVKPKVNIKYIVLPSDCLKGNHRVISEVDGAKARIVSGLRATRAVTGQGRWGIWREEARTIARTLGGRDQAFFFYTLMTGFLSTHTDWLQALSPLSYRKRYLQQQKARSEEDMSLPARTVIVAQDKIVARRLVFLLSAFLPANQQLPVLRAHRPSTSASVSQSPPSGVVTIVREESLRRKITGNRRAGPRQHSRNISIQSQTARPQGVPPPLAHLAFEGHHERKSSELSLMRQPSATAGDRKSSAATTATVTPETTIPHFSTAHRRSDSRPSLRPGSSESIAADDLKRSLTRSDSTGQVSIITNDSRSQGSRWGSVISGLWSPRRRDSASSTLHTPTSTHSPMSPVKGRHQGYRGNKLADMVQESECMEARDLFPAAESPRTPRQLGPPTRAGSDHLETRPGAFESAVKTSVNAADGVIDVDVPFPDYLTAFETAVSSPSSSGYISTPGFNSGLEAFEHSCRTGLEGDMPFNVGGWLQEFHPDFTLQAIPPQPDLMNQVKAALRAEPTPAALPSLEPDHPMADRWVDVSTALVADSTTCSVLKIRYRRLVRPKASSASQTLHHTSLITPSVAPYETQLDEKFIEEQIFTLEEAFTDAVEKVISQSGPAAPNSSADVTITTSGSKLSSGSASASSSRSTSKLRDRHDSLAPPSQEVDIPESALPLSLTPRLPPAPTEVPRSKCRTVVLSSLEDLVLDVVEQRNREGQQEGQRTVPVSRERENVLREAVRCWLDAIDVGEQT